MRPIVGAQVFDVNCFMRAMHRPDNSTSVAGTFFDSANFWAERRMSMKISSPRIRWYLLPIALVVSGIVSLTGCVPINQVQAPSLREVRLGNVRGQVTADNRLLPGEISGEVTEIDRGRREIIVRTDDSRRDVLPFDFER